jgi:phosphate transport system substrate-binding protein
VKLQRHGILACLAVTATLALAACGSDNNTSPTTTGSGGSGAASTISCAQGSIKGAGSSAQGNAITTWTKNYQTACSGATIDYNPSGSGAGLQAFIAGTIDFAGSDSPLSAADQPKANARCKTGAAIHLPMVVGPIAVVYNVTGITSLQLKPATIAKIFSGKVATWNDPAIAADNPGATLPSGKILAIHRQDSSGTTDNFTKFLSKTAAADWSFGNDKNWKAAGGQAEKGSDGIAAAIGKSDGSISYVEWSFAQGNSLKMAKIGNGAGEFAELTADGAGKTIASAKTTGTGNDMQLSIDYNTKAAGAYPLVLVTYEVVCEKGTPSAALPLVKSFMTYIASTGGQAAAAKVGYAPLPDEVRTKVASTAGSLS